MANKTRAPEGTQTRNALRDAAYRSCPNLSRAEVRRIFDETLEEISDALLRGENVKLRTFGIFKVRQSARGSAATLKPASMRPLPRAASSPSRRLRCF